MLSPVTCVTRGFDSLTMSGWYPAMTNRTDAKLLEVLRREVGWDRLAYLVVAECRLILPEAQAPQPTSEAHHAPRVIPGISPEVAREVHSSPRGH